MEYRVRPDANFHMSVCVYVCVLIDGQWKNDKREGNQSVESIFSHFIIHSFISFIIHQQRLFSYAYLYKIRQIQNEHNNPPFKNAYLVSHHCR